MFYGLYEAAFVVVVEWVADWGLSVSLTGRGSRIQFQLLPVRVYGSEASLLAVVSGCSCCVFAVQVPRT